MLKIQDLNGYTRPQPQRFILPDAQGVVSAVMIPAGGDTLFDQLYVAALGAIVSTGKPLEVARLGGEPLETFVTHATELAAALAVRSLMVRRDVFAPVPASDPSATDGTPVGGGDPE